MPYIHDPLDREAEAITDAESTPRLINLDRENAVDLSGTSVPGMHAGIEESMTRNLVCANKP